MVTWWCGGTDQYQLCIECLSSDRVPPTNVLGFVACPSMLPSWSNELLHHDQAIQYYLSVQHITLDGKWDV